MNELNCQIALHILVMRASVTTQHPLPDRATEQLHIILTLTSALSVHYDIRRLLIFS